MKFIKLLLDEDALGSRIIRTAFLEAYLFYVST
jgi:hypothetical protein